MANGSSAIDHELGELLELGDRILKMTLDRGGKGLVAECVLRSGAELSARVRKGEPELVEEAGTRSAGLRVIQERRVASTSTSDLTPAGIERFVADAVELVGLSQEDPFAGPADPKLLCDPTTLPDLDLYDPAGGGIDAARAIVLAREGEAAAFAFDKRITNSEGATFGRTAGGSAIVLSSGFRGVAKGSYQSLSVVPVAADEGGKNRRGYHWTARRHLAELDPADEVGREAARRTLRKLGARTVATTEAPVVFDPDAARSILGLLAGCVMGSSIWRKSSYLMGREGTRVASDLVSVVDDPFLPRAPGSRPFDGEGLASRRNVVVEKGVLRTYLCDSYSARKLGRESTASASRGGGAGVGPSTSNFVLQPGTDSNEAIIKGTPRGLYVTEMMGFGFNAVTGDFSRGAAGFWIENGELAFPVSELTISLNVDELWKSIDAVGSDLDLRTATAAPTLRVAKMTIAGGGQ
ncbi:MAG TPA: metallopeptidase TldD-related protein [Polyangiaceae bacterium]|jgi:PmbA protein|nr:metallopeptidase TldD-related protein [Polyangiaceae bacterium]